MAKQTLTPRSSRPTFERIRTEKIVDVVRKRSGTGWSEGMRLGVPTDVIRKEVIEWGVADFSVGWSKSGHPKLTAADKVLLYCFFNMRRHYDELRIALHLSEASLQFDDSRLLIVDFGCGPATGALAFASEFAGTPFDYVGLDSALEMRRMGRKLWDAAVMQGLIHRKSNARFKATWDANQLEGLPEGTIVILLFSYFFASKSLNNQRLKSIKDYVDRYAAERKISDLILLYTNSPKGQAAKSYWQFKKKFKGSFAMSVPKTIEVEYSSIDGVNVVPFDYELTLIK
jgi:hypothetical protein